MAALYAIKTRQIRKYFPNSCGQNLTLVGSKQDKNKRDKIKKDTLFQQNIK